MLTVIITTIIIIAYIQPDNKYKYNSSIDDKDHTIMRSWSSTISMSSALKKAALNEAGWTKD